MLSVEKDRTEPLSTPLKSEENSEIFDIRLPDIRKILGPIRRPPPRMSPYKQESMIQGYMNAAGRPSQYYRRVCGVRQEKPRERLLRQMNEESVQSPYSAISEKVIPPRVYIAARSPYNDGQKQILAKPSWWG